MDIPPYSSQTMAYYGLSMAPLHLFRLPNSQGAGRVRLRPLQRHVAQQPQRAAPVVAVGVAGDGSGADDLVLGGRGVTIHSYGKNGPSIVDLPGENGDLLGEDGDLPGENGDLPGENGDLLGENGDLPGENCDFLWLC